MSEKILITGRPGTGKSTLARYLIRGFDTFWAGFRTRQNGDSPAGPLYGMEAMPAGECAPISCYAEGAVRPVPQTFETLGVTALQKALTGPEPVILMDEIGRFERSCPQFLATVDEVLHSDKTVIAVVKKEPLPHLEKILSLPGAILVDLDTESRADARRRLAQKLWPKNPLSWGLTLRLYGMDKSFGPGPMQLLRGGQRTGTLQGAAAAMGMAYSKAWKMLKALEEEWGFALLQSTSGGAKGGQSQLTPQAADLLQRYSAMLEEVQAAADQAFEKHFGTGNL